MWEEAAEARAREASCLERNGHLHGAIYLAGYVVECLLKSYLQHKRVEFPRSGPSGHDLRALWKKAGLMPNDLAGRKRAFVDTWNTSIRYKTCVDSAHQPEDLLKGAYEIVVYLRKRIPYARSGARRRGRP